MNVISRNTLAALGMLALSIGPAAALTTANGSFGFIPVGDIVADTGDLSLTTATLTYPDLVRVNTVSATFAGHPNNLGISLGDAVALSSPTFTFPAGLTEATTNFDVTVAGLTFTFTDVTTTERIATGGGASGFLGAEYIGSLTGDTSGTFDLGTPASMAQNCNQAAPTGSIDCSDTTAITVGQVDEPASLAVLGAALAGMGLFGRIRSVS